ncbi:MAG: bifunctional ornithine acetyltransferase/N-acetylglutamate synthase [Ignavibacteria bacterium]|nr:bifunctional ornithine acetyltransferase/N-acetylglutamate synthase [Ignavibacteria bacterium]
MHQFIPEGTITSVRGFKAAGIFCGIKKQKKDIALIYSDKPCSAAGTFTLNKVVAAPNVISKNIIKQQGKVRTILVNSGNANACTGAIGFENALASQSYSCKKIVYQSF